MSESAAAHPSDGALAAYANS